MVNAVKQAIGKDDKSIGSWNESTILSTHIYNIETPDGTTKK